MRIQNNNTQPYGPLFDTGLIAAYFDFAREKKRETDFDHAMVGIEQFIDNELMNALKGKQSPILGQLDRLYKASSYEEICGILHEIAESYAHHH